MINTPSLRRMNTIAQKKLIAEYGSQEAARELAIVVKSIGLVNGKTKPSSEADILVVIDDYNDRQFNITVSLLDIMQNLKSKYYYVYNIDVILDYLGKLKYTHSSYESLLY
jgi:hypothetical protein